MKKWRDCIRLPPTRSARGDLEVNPSPTSKYESEKEKEDKNTYSENERGEDEIETGRWGEKEKGERIGEKGREGGGEWRRHGIRIVWLVPLNFAFFFFFYWIFSYHIWTMNISVDLLKRNFVRWIRFSFCDVAVVSFSFSGNTAVTLDLLICIRLFIYDKFYKN